jgi:hypothetical protein
VMQIRYSDGVVEEDVPSEALKAAKKRSESGSDGSSGRRDASAQRRRRKLKRSRYDNALLLRRSHDLINVVPYSCQLKINWNRHGVTLFARAARYDGKCPSSLLLRLLCD